MCEQVRPFVGESTAPAEAARFWLACALHGSDSSPSTAIKDGKQAVALHHLLGDRIGEYLSCNYLAFAFQQLGRTGEASEALSKALALRDPSWPDALRMRVDNVAIMVCVESGRLADARSHACNYLELARRTGDVREQRTAASLVVDVELLVGNVDGAASEATRALAAAPPGEERSIASNRSGDGLNLRNFATALTLAGRLDEADAIYREALVRAKRGFGTSAFVLLDAATLVARRGDLENAARVRAYALQAYERSGRQPRRGARQLDERLCATLAAKRSSDELARLFEEGRAWTDEQACATAFPALTPEK